MGLVTDYSWAVKQYWSSCMCVHALHCMPSCSVSTHPFSVCSVWQQCPRIQKVITRGINLHRFQTHKHSGIITVFFWIVSNFNIFIQNMWNSHFVLIVWTFLVTLTIYRASQTFCMTFQMMIIYHQTNFAYKSTKMLAVLKISFGQNLYTWKNGETSIKTRRL